MHEVVITAVMAALVKKIVDLRYQLQNGDWRGVVTQLLAWAAGILVTLLAAQSDWADTAVVGDVTLADMNLASQILAGLALGSTASLAYDFSPQSRHRAAGTTIPGEPGTPVANY